MGNTSSSLHGDVQKTLGVKLAAIYNMFDGEELLIGSMRCLKDSVDLFIIVHQNISNFGEQYDPLKYLPVAEMDAEFPIRWVYYEPGITGMMDEKMKRNYGINVAKHFGCTHFILMDCDEYYMPGDFEKGKQLFLASGKDGSVVSLFTYFKSAELRQEILDSYYVPFIHELKPYTVTGNTTYPMYVDPTRRVNSEYAWQLPVIMHHYSWVRRDIHRKARNSSAKKNIEKSSLMQDWETAVEGSIVNGGNKLIKVPDYFGVNQMIRTLESV